MYNFFEKSDKYFFAGLFNTALDNFQEALEEVYSRVNGGIGAEAIEFPDNTVSLINKLFPRKKAGMSVKVTLFEIERNLKLLVKNVRTFELLNVFYEKLIKNQKEGKVADPLSIDYREFVNRAILTLWHVINHRRNFYTHLNSIDDFTFYRFGNSEDADLEWGKEFLFRYLDFVLLRNAHDIKNDRMKNPNVRIFLEKKPFFKDDKNHIAQNHFKKLQTKYENSNNQNDKKKIRKVSNEHKSGFAFNSTTKRFIFEHHDKSKQVLSTSLKKSKHSKNESSRLTREGLIGLLCMLLNKGQAQILFDNIAYTENSTDTKLQKLVSRWVFTTRSYKNVKSLHYSDYEDDGFLLQLVNELSKCPKELYEQLNENDKAEFLEAIDYNISEEQANYDGDGDTNYEVIRKRYENKFPYFAIRFLDEKVDFPTLKFHVNVGSFKRNTQQKEYPNSDYSPNRTINENLAVFQKLSIVADKKRSYLEHPNFQDEKRRESEENTGNIWKEYPKPSYRYHKNNIPIWLDVSSCDALKNIELGNYSRGNEQEGVLRTSGRYNKHRILQLMFLQHDIKRPVALLSFNELPSLIHEILVKKTPPKDVEVMLLKKIKSRVEQLLNYSSDEELPSKLKNRIADIEQYNLDKISRHIHNMTKENPLKDIRGDRYESGKVLSNSEKGKLAVWLSEDIKRMVKKRLDQRLNHNSENKEKTFEGWKGHEFAEFQKLLSYYDFPEEKKNFKEHCIHILKLNLSTDLPFDGIDLDQNSLLDLFNIYFEARKKYLYSFLNRDKVKVVNDEKLFEFRENSLKEVLLILNENKFKKKSLERFKKNLGKNPICLDRGIFQDLPTFTKRTNEKTVPINPEFADGGFAQWFIDSSDRMQAQEFYSYTRCYRLSENKKITLNNSKNIKDAFNNTLSIAKSEKLSSDVFTKRNVYQTEAAIRKRMREDYFMLEMIKYFYENSNEEDTSLDVLNLNKFYLTKTEIEEVKERLKYEHVRAPGDNSDSVLNMSKVLSKPIRVSFLNGCIKGEVKLKEKSKYRKFSERQLVKQIVEYYPKHPLTSEAWTFEQMAKEVHNYDLNRARTIFKEIHVLENRIYSIAERKGKVDELKDHNGNLNFRFYLQHAFLIGNQKVQFKNLYDKILQGNNLMPHELENEKFMNLALVLDIRNKFSHSYLPYRIMFDYAKSKVLLKKEEIEGAQNIEMLGDYFHRVLSFLSLKLIEELEFEKRLNA